MFQNQDFRDTFIRNGLGFFISNSYVFANWSDKIFSLSKKLSINVILKVSKLWWQLGTGGKSSKFLWKTENMFHNSLIKKGENLSISPPGATQTWIPLTFTVSNWPLQNNIYPFGTIPALLYEQDSLKSSPGAHVMWIDRNSVNNILLFLEWNLAETSLLFSSAFCFYGCY